MREFLIEHYSILTKSAEIIAAMTGLVFYGKYKNTSARYFIFFLVYIAFLETTGSYVKFVRADKFLHFLMGTLIEANYWMYTLGWKIAAIVFFSFYYYKILRSTRLKMILKYVGWAYLVFSVIFIVIYWKDFFHMSFPTLSILGAVVIFTCCTFYFVELMQSERILYFYKSLNFYISVVIFIWWLIITPLVFYNLYYGSFDLSKPFRHPEFFGDINYITLQKLIYLFSNMFMYLTYTFALLWCKPEND